jgi:translation elongation factor EF-G
MRVEVVTPDIHLGDVVSDLNNRRGTIIGSIGNYLLFSADAGAYWIEGAHSARCARRPPGARVR